MVSLAGLFTLGRIRLLIFAVVSLAAVLLGSGAWSPEPYRRLGNAIDDWRQVRLLSGKPETRIAIVDIDERSLQAIGPWPWPRAVVARLAQNLFVDYRAKAVGLDIMFPDADTPAGDQTLLAVAHRFPLVFAEAFALSANATADANADANADATATADAPRAGHVAGAVAAGGQAKHAPVASGYVGNFFEGADVCVGHVTPHASLDGVVRSVAPLIRYQNAAYPMLAWRLMNCDVGGRATALPLDRLPVDGQGLMHVDFSHSLQSFDVISAYDVLAQTAPVALIAKRYVLVGSSALGLTDHVASPIDAWLPAVVVHAELLGDMLDLVSDGGPRFLAWLPAVWTACAIIAFAWLFRLQRASIALVALVVSTLSWLALLATTHVVRPDLAALPVVVAGAFLLVQAPLEWVYSQAAIRSFERRFSRYLPPTVLREIIRQRGLDVFTPERRQISVLFVDIEGYTRLAEQMPPEQLAAMTDVILTCLTDCVHQTQGTLDKYMGDALMAFWGAPLSQPDHADRALDCALAMLHELNSLNDRQMPVFGGKVIRVRIGVNSGAAVVGEIGSTFRKSYTAIGDTVNVASRLQELAKTFETSLLIGQETARQTARHRLRAYAQAALRGRDAAEQLYTAN